MCGRYITPDEAAIERYWGLSPREPLRLEPSYNFAPTQSGPVVVGGKRGVRELELFQWGFQPSWSKRAWINARAETVLESRAFKSAARQRRCLVLAAGWYEWQGSKPPKQPYLFRRVDGDPIAFAGIWTLREVNDDVIANYAIITTAAPKEIEPIHNRMPLIVDPLAYDRWLDPIAPVADFGALLDNLPDDENIEAYRVSTEVNAVRNNSPNLIQPINGQNR